VGWLLFFVRFLSCFEFRLPGKTVFKMIGYVFRFFVRVFVCC